MNKIKLGISDAKVAKEAICFSLVIKSTQMKDKILKKKTFRYSLKRYLKSIGILVKYQWLMYNKSLVYKILILFTKYQNAKKI
jgi:hypothetical protein